MKNKIIPINTSFKSKKNIEVKYSTLLDQFIMPFANDFSDTSYYEDMFEFAITAWNLGT